MPGYPSHGPKRHGDSFPARLHQLQAVPPHVPGDLRLYAVRQAPGAVRPPGAIRPSGVVRPSGAIRPSGAVRTQSPVCPSDAVRASVGLKKRRAGQMSARRPSLTAGCPAVFFSYESCPLPTLPKKVSRYRPQIPTKT